MAKFHYRGTDHNGDAVDGVMEGSTAHQVTQILQERGFTVSSVEGLKAAQGMFARGRQLSWEDLHILVTQLESITRTDLPLASALKGLAADLRNPRLKPVLDQLQRDLDHGEELESAFQRQQDRIPPLFAHLVHAGAAAGNVHAVLQDLCGYTERMIRLRNAFKAAAYYPILVLFLALAILGVLMTGVAPPVEALYTEVGRKLPLVSRFWFGAAHLVQAQPAAFLAALGLLAAFVLLAPRAMARSESGRWWLDTIQLNLPVFGTAQKALSLMRFCKTLSVLLHARIPIVESLELAGAASGSTVLMHLVDGATLEVASGETIGASLNRGGFFGHYFHWAVNSSEARGDLPAVLSQLGDHYEREVLYRERMLGALLAPVLLFIAGIIILSIIVSIYYPVAAIGSGGVFSLGGSIN